MAGGTGALGQEIVKRLVENDISVRILCRNLQKAHSLFGKEPKVSYVEFDILKHLKTPVSKLVDLIF